MKRRLDEYPLPSVVPIRLRSGNIGEQQPGNEKTVKNDEWNNSSEYSTNEDESSQTAADGGTKRPRRKRQHTIKSSYLQSYVEEVKEPEEEKMEESVNAKDASASSVEIVDIDFNDYEPIVEGFEDEKVQNEEFNSAKADASVEIVEVDEDGKEIKEIDEDEDKVPCPENCSCGSDSTTDFEEMGPEAEAKGVGKKDEKEYLKLEDVEPSLLGFKKVECRATGNVSSMFEHLKPSTMFEEGNFGSSHRSNASVGLGYGEPSHSKLFSDGRKRSRAKKTFTSTVVRTLDFEAEDVIVGNAVMHAAEKGFGQEDAQAMKRGGVFNKTNNLKRRVDAQTLELIDSIYGKENRAPSHGAGNSVPSSSEGVCGTYASGIASRTDCLKILEEAKDNHLESIVDMKAKPETDTSPATSDVVGEMEVNEPTVGTSEPPPTLPLSQKSDDSSTDYTTEEDDEDDLLSIHSSDEEKPSKINNKARGPDSPSGIVKSETMNCSKKDTSFSKPISKNVAAAKQINQSFCSSPAIASDHIVEILDDDDEDDRCSNSSMTTIMMGREESSFLESDILEDSMLSTLDERPTTASTAANPMKPEPMHDSVFDHSDSDSIIPEFSFPVGDYYGSFMVTKQKNMNDHNYGGRTRGRGRTHRGRRGWGWWPAANDDDDPVMGQQQQAGNKKGVIELEQKTIYTEDVRRFIHRLEKSNKTKPNEEEDYGSSANEVPPMKVKLYHHQVYGLKWLLWREAEFPGGGILADEMGLGKTIMILALIKKAKVEYDKPTVADCKMKDCIPSASTLIVSPVSCLYQWKDEISKKAGNLSSFVYHGPERHCVGANSLAKYDVVLTTFDTIAHEIPSDDSVVKKMMRISPLKKVYWLRIVLDEGHEIRNPKTKRAIAVCQLEAKHRWVVTGTPIHNSTSDFFSLVKFLRMTPFDDIKVWNNWIGSKLERRTEGDQKRLHLLGQTLILRRTKEEVQALKKDADCSEIPPKLIEIVTVELDDNERAIYDQLMTFSQSIFKEFLENRERRKIEKALGEAGVSMVFDTVAKANDLEDAKMEWNKLNQPIEFMHLFALIVRLRQCAVLPFLIEGILEDTDEAKEESQAIREGIEKLIRKDNPLFSPGYQSSKIKKILEDLEELRKTTTDSEGRMEKVVIVSSWVKLLNALYVHMKAKGFSARFLTGQDSVDDRAHNMQLFNGRGNSPQILLLSLFAGAVGINLTGGNHVFFVEPHWNPQIERQAQDRVHRFGQKRNVFIRRYITDGTIEDRILDLQEKKIELADGMLANTKAAAGGLNLQQMRHLFEC